MMQKYKDRHLCTFVHCYPTPIYLQQQDVLVKYNKREPKGEKISLRRVQSRCELANTQQKSEQYQEKMTHNTSPLFTETVNNNAVTPRIIGCPVSPKPKITFAWKTDLERTKKAQNKEQVERNPHIVDPQLQKTKPVGKTLKIPTNLYLSTYNASLTSISDEEQKNTPKVEQSLIVVNYFNPTIQQKKTLQTLLERRQSQEQN